MNHYDLTSKNGIDHETIDRRDMRALTECMTVMEHAPEVAGADGLFLVITESGATYIVDVLNEARCTCPDAQYNLPTEEGRRTCKHAARVTYETGMRPIPTWANRDSIESQLLEAHHVDGHPVFAVDQRAVKDEEDDIAATNGRRQVVADGGRERPVDCCCGDDLPCFMCWQEGFRTPPNTANEDAQ